MRGDGHCGILRAGGLIATAAHAQRVHRRRKPATIKREYCEQNAGHHACGAETTRGAGSFALRAASALACVRIRTTSASSFANSSVSTARRGCKIKSEARGKTAG